MESNNVQVGARFPIKYLLTILLKESRLLCAAILKLIITLKSCISFYSVARILKYLPNLEQKGGCRNNFSLLLVISNNYRNKKFDNDIKENYIM